MSGCRIRSVRSKAGGAEIRVLHAPNPPGDIERQIGDDMRNVLRNDVPIVFYALVTLHENGNWASAWQFDRERADLPRAALPSIVAEMLRQEMITEDVAGKVVNYANGFAPEDDAS